MNIQRYAKIKRWAKKRYQQHGFIIVAKNSQATTYQKIMKLAQDRYL